MTKYKCRKRPSGLYDVTVITPDGGQSIVYDMTPARKDNLIRVIREFNDEAERQRAVEQSTPQSQNVMRWKDYIRNEKAPQ
ncbi:MAG: hypothetical protein KHX31_03775 [Akkermansia sp.]|uniref:hypothetical protein n=1 Tax=Akkermansia sp. TaxID=1872421 RepID=UPI0025C6240B|nr:hypothetical protein [Akkermansia sp.]MBS5507734.1 hypothetical protein [Akkermansia sp.]